MKVELAPFATEHLARTCAWLSEQALRQDFLMHGKITGDGSDAPFRQALQDPTQKVFAIVSDGDHVGNCGLKNLDPGQGRGELWVYIGDYHLQGRGIGREATRRLLREAFVGAALEEVYLHVASFNAKAIALYQKFGFQETLCEGCTGWDEERRRWLLHMELTKERWQLKEQRAQREARVVEQAPIKEALA